MTKYIFVTGGVVSGLGKGITAASLGRLLKSRGTPPRAIRLAGGVVNSPAWVQLFADVFAMDVETVEVSELGALGAAIAAAVAAGRYASPQQAAAAMSRPGKTYQPNAGCAAIYRRKYEAFLTAEAALAPLWAKLNKK